MSLGALPEISFCNVDAKNIELSVILTYEAITGTKLYPGDPVRLFLESLASVVVMQRVIIDTSAKQNLLSFATGEKLDHLGALTGTSRLGASASGCVVRFTRKPGSSDQVNVSSGTRVGPDTNLLFQVLESRDIEAGQEFVDLKVECLIAGPASNGFLPGQITEIIDFVADGISVQNRTETTGGADVESDDNFRERIHMSVERYTTAGTRGGYEYWAKTAHQDIVDVSVHSPEPGLVKVYPLLTGGRLPDDAVLNLVREILDDDSVIPLTDTCQVLVPDLVPTSINITWFLAQSDSAMAGTIQAAVLKAVEEYRAWQIEKLGRDINPTELIYRVKKAGAVRVEVIAPVHVVLELWQVASIGPVNVDYGGLE